MRKRLFSPVVLLVITASILQPCVPAWAWIDCGHKIVALIAFDELTPKAKAAVLEALKKHPRYDKDLAAYAPDGATGEILDRHVFATAATWPDLVRSQDNPMHTLYSHPQWHYIDIPFLADGTPAPAEKYAEAEGPHNIVEALQKSVADVKSDSVPASEKAVSICWILHLVGDIHEPLHAAGMITKELPDGDRGGNSLFVLRDPPYPNSRTNLHLLWDELPGQFKSETLNGYEAVGIRSDPRYSRENLKDALAVTDFMAWAKESHDLAVQYAYLNGKLEYSTTPDNGGQRGSYSRNSTTGPSNSRESATRPFSSRMSTTRPSRDLGPRASGGRDGAQRDSTPGVPPGYIARSEEVVARQLALAGHRLADVLNSLYDPR